MLSASGCRGIVGESLTPEVLARLTGAIASWVRDVSSVEEPSVILARDGRRGGTIIQWLVCAALRAGGCRVIDLGVAATPTAGILVRHHSADAGVVVTASHNPGEWNGLKVIDAGGAAPCAAQANDILDRYAAGRVALAPSDRLGCYGADDTAAHVHVARVLDAIEHVVSIDTIRRRHFTVVLDSVNAAGRIGGRLLLEALGCTLIHIHADESGVFPHTPEPLAENLVGLCDAVRDHGADVGFAQDPDADRLAIVDEKGDFLGEEYTFVLSALAILGSAHMDAKKAVLAVNLSTSRMIDDATAAHGARVVRTPVGEANVVEAMRREGAILGGEGNGGVIWPDVVPIRDSLSAMALTLALMARTGEPVRTLADRVPAYAIEKRKLPIRPDMADRVLETLASLFPGARADRQDGLRLDFPTANDGGMAWLHARESNTEPVFRLIAEAPTREIARDILDQAQAHTERTFLPSCDDLE